MKRIVLYILLLLIVNAYGQQRQQNNIFVADTSINRVLYLLDKESIIKTLGNQNGKLIDDEKPSRIQLKNRNGSQYLIMYHLNGSNSNSFNLFEFGFLYHRNDNFIKTNFENFYTQDGIELGISKEKLIKIKGIKFTNKYRKHIEIIEYKVNKDNKQFLLRYNMPVYIDKYYFKKNKLIKILFGFPNL